MVDIDLKRDDRHTLAPIKAAWIDRDTDESCSTRRCSTSMTRFPRCGRRAGPVEDESVRHFNERYERAYGADGWDRDRDITIRRANDDLRISRSTPPPRVAIRPTCGRRNQSRRRRSRHVMQKLFVTPGCSPNAAGSFATDPLATTSSSTKSFGVASSTPENLSPAETERIRQQSGDVTTDARDTLVNPPPTEERR